MLTLIKGILRELLPLSLYLGIWAGTFYAIFKNARVAVMLLVVLAANPNVWYAVHPFPLGKDSTDLLFFAAAIGVAINCGGYQRAPRQMLIVLYALMLFAAVWNCSLRFDFGVPLFLSHPLVPHFKNYLQMILLYVISFNAFKNEEEQKKLIILLGVIFLLICIRDIRNFTGGAAFSYDKRTAGPFWQVGLGPNQFAAFLAYMGSFFLGLLLLDKHKRRRMLYIAAAACTIVPLFSTYSRGAWVALLFALLIFGLLKSRIILVGIAVLVVSWQSVLPSAVVERVTMTESADGEIEESAALRLVLWQRAEELFKGNPVFGIGYEGFAKTVNISGLNNVHNYYLQIAAEQGLIGLLFFTVLLLACGFSAFSLFRNKEGSDFQRGLGLGLLGAVATLAVSNVFGDRWSPSSTNTWFWVLWGIADRAAFQARSAKKLNVARESSVPAMRPSPSANAVTRL